MQHARERHHATVRAVGLDAQKPTPVLLKRGGPVSRRGTAGSTDLLADLPADPPNDPPLAEQRKLARRARRQSRYDEVIALRTAGASVAAIHGALGLRRKTIVRWLGGVAFPERQPAVRRETSLTPHAAYLGERCRGGCHNVTELWREIHDGRGFHGGLTTVLAWARLHLPWNGDIGSIASGDSVSDIAPIFTPRGLADHRSVRSTQSTGTALCRGDLRRVEHTCECA